MDWVGENMSTLGSKVIIQHPEIFVTDPVKILSDYVTFLIL